MSKHVSCTGTKNREMKCGTSRGDKKSFQFVGIKHDTVPHVDGLAQM